MLHRFPGGGGLLTYCKERLKKAVTHLTLAVGHDCQDGGIFVHTLNTESGLIRKVDALRLCSHAPALLGMEPVAAKAAWKQILQSSSKL